MNSRRPTEAQSDVPIVVSGSERLPSGNAREMEAVHVNRESVGPPSIPKTIALILGTLLLAIFLTALWPFGPL
jgi:hypothetical protein